jgi:hypothetical protein
MRRREFIPFLGGALAWPLPAHAQQPTKVIRIGFLDPEFASDAEVYNERFRAGLRAFNPTNPVTLRVLPAMALTATSLELELQQSVATRLDELASAFLDMSKRRANPMRL